MLITEKTFPLWAKSVAYPADPEEYNQEAVNRLTDRIDKYIVRVKGVKPQFHAINTTQLIDFESDADREYYHAAYDRYLQEKAKLENAEGLGSNSRFAILVELLKFRQAAEWIRAPYLAREMWKAVNNGKAAVCASNFRGTITRAAMILMEDYNIPRDKISLIWGGGQVVQTKKGKTKKKILETEGLEELLKAQGISLDDINLGDSVEVKKEIEFDPKYRMGPQSQQQRQEEIDRFQRGESLYCFFTFKAGGVGLSLHHTDEFTEFKCRRKESGYVVEEDIPKVPTRPRETFLSPTYSAIESVQGLGRAPRLTSLSNTRQTILYFRGTIEVRVKAIMDVKLKCLSKIVRIPDQSNWDGIIGASEKEYKEIENKSKGIADDEEGDDSMLSDNPGESDD